MVHRIRANFAPKSSFVAKSNEEPQKAAGATNLRYKLMGDELGQNERERRALMMEVAIGRGIQSVQLRVIVARLNLYLRSRSFVGGWI
jgi:hypothetical protein